MAAVTQVKMDLQTISLLERVRSYVIQGKDFNGDDRSWTGQVKINKEVNLRVTTKNGETRFVKLPKDKSFMCTMRELMKLVLRMIQEGPEELKQDITAQGNKRITGEPLQIQIVSTSVLTEYAIDRKISEASKSEIPSLDN